MWTDNSKFHTILRIALVVLALVLAVVILIIYNNVSKQTAKTDEELLQVYEQHQLSQQEERLSSIEEVNAEYEKDMQTVAEYLPGVVCWGDSLTVGSASGASYPSTLQSLINEHICDIYDFRSTIENADELSRIDWSNYTLEIPVVNLGGGGEDCNTILGRNGAFPFTVEVPFVIPENREPVKVRFTDSVGNEVTPLIQNDAGTNSVAIAGVEGTLSLDGIRHEYTFTRLEPGEKVNVEKGDAIVTSASTQYKDYISIIFIGTYGGFSSEADLISKINAIRLNRDFNKDRYIVIGLPDRADGVWIDKEHLETRMLSEFGDHYINLRSYLLSDALKDAGIAPTSSDQSRLSNNEIPYSLLASKNSAELNATSYKLLGGVVYDRMESLGYFDEVVNELGIKETRKELQALGKYRPRG